MMSLYLIATLAALIAAATAVYRWRARRARGDLFTAIGMILLAGSLILRQRQGASLTQTVVLGCAVVVILYGAYLRSKTGGRL
jgi:hypothetical protein